MGSKQLVLALFESEAAADEAAQQLKAWESGTSGVKLDAVGILVLDENGNLKQEKVGRRSTGKGAGIGLVLAMVTPVGLAAGVIGGGLLGHLHHKGLGISNEERERIGAELADGKAAVGALVDPSLTVAVSSVLADIGGTPEAHDIDDDSLAEVDAAATVEPTTDTAVDVTYTAG